MENEHNLRIHNELWITRACIRKQTTDGKSNHTENDSMASRTHQCHKLNKICYRFFMIDFVQSILLYVVSFFLSAQALFCLALFFQNFQLFPTVVKLRGFFDESNSEIPFLVWALIRDFLSRYQTCHMDETAIHFH